MSFRPLVDPPRRRELIHPAGKKSSSMQVQGSIFLRTRDAMRLCSGSLLPTSTGWAIHLTGTSPRSDDGPPKSPNVDAVRLGALSSISLPCLDPPSCSSSRAPACSFLTSTNPVMHRVGTAHRGPKKSPRCLCRRVPVFLFCPLRAVFGWKLITPAVRHHEVHRQHPRPRRVRLRYARPLATRLGPDARTATISINTPKDVAPWHEFQNEASPCPPSDATALTLAYSGRRLELLSGCLACPSAAWTDADAVPMQATRAPSSLYRPASRRYGKLTPATASS